MAAEVAQAPAKRIHINRYLTAFGSAQWGRALQTLNSLSDVVLSLPSIRVQTYFKVPNLKIKPSDFLGPKAIFLHSYTKRSQER